ncbi:MAG: hypothetical protein QM784_02385 [Polyangiaceae bacterium]
MRMTLASLTTNVAILATLAMPSLAAAQDAAPAAPPPPAAAEVAPAPVAAAPTPTDAAPPAAAAAPAPAAPAAEAPAETPIPSYFRLDHDYMFGLQLWAGATYPLTDKIGLATDVYIAENYVSAGDTGAVQSYWGEFDIGPALTLGPVALTPMVGVAFDWAAKKAVALNGPQLYTIVSLDKFYFESWIWTMLYSAFDKKGPNDYIHTRNWALYKVTDKIGVGPQLEYTYDIEDKKTIYGFPVGGHVELAYGTGNSLGLFLGYDTKKSTRVDDAAAVGRITFVHNF